MILASAGKTTFLQHMIQNEVGMKFGLVVNDMASVNVDSKLIRQQTSDGGVDTLELQNGCVCCSLAEDLIGYIPLDIILNIIAVNYVNMFNSNSRSCRKTSQSL